MILTSVAGVMFSSKREKQKTQYPDHEDKQPIRKCTRCYIWLIVGGEVKSCSPIMTVGGGILWRRYPSVRGVLDVTKQIPGRWSS